MARIRSVHPGLFTDEDFVELTAFARLALIGIWTEAWDDGVLEWRPSRLKMRLFPLDNIEMPALLSELEQRGFLRRFEANGALFAAIRNFRKWQNPKTPNSSGVLPGDLRQYVGLPCIQPDPFPRKGETPECDAGPLPQDVETPEGDADPFPQDVEMPPQKGGREEGRKGGREEGRKGGREEGKVESQDNPSPDGDAAPSAAPDEEAPAPPPPKASPEDDGQLAEAFAAWNALAADLGLPIAKLLGEDRRRKLRARLREDGGVAGWTDALRRVRETPFLRGENPRGWRPSLDWIVERRNFTRVAEGTYGSLLPLAAPVAPPTRAPESLPGGADAAPDPWGIRAWLATLPDVRMADFDEGQPQRPSLCGWDPVMTCQLIAEAVELPESWRGKWDALADWMRADIWDPDTCVPAMARRAKRLRTPIFSVRIFDEAVHVAAGRPYQPRGSEPD